MATLHSITKFKQKIMELILSDQECANLIADRQVEVLPAMSLRYKNVFPYARDPDIESDAKVFVCFEVDMDSSYTGEIAEYQLSIWVFCHNSLAIVKNKGVRTDLLTARINDLLLGNRDFGIGKLTIRNSYRFSPTFDYNGRVTTYNPFDFN